MASNRKVSCKHPCVKLRTTLSPAKNCYLLLWANLSRQLSTYSQLLTVLLYVFVFFSKQFPVFWSYRITHNLKSRLSCLGMSQFKETQDFKILTKYVSLLYTVSTLPFQFCANLVEKDS